MKKKSADFKSFSRETYYKNLPIEVQGYKLEVTGTATVYCNTDRGKRKLDSLWLKTGILSVSLPDGKEVDIVNTPEGLKVKDEV